MFRFFLCMAVVLPALGRFPAWAENYLIYFEAQGVAGYSSEQDKTIYYSKDEEETMQKSSAGFDYLHRLSGDKGDYGALALQLRAAYDTQDDKKDIEFQLYNAYAKYKSDWSDLWIGHNRPALGLSAYFDTHAHLLDTLAMNNFGYDRDWGVGAYKDFSWGNLAVSMTTGSGMPLRFKGNWLGSARVSRGILNQDNYNLGFSGGYGETLETMGYNLMNDEPRNLALMGIDLTYMWNNLESRWDAMAGRNQDEEAYALYWRLGINMLEEGRLKLEAQPMYLKIGAGDSYQLSTGTSYQLTSDITLRAMYRYDEDPDDHKVIFQIYWYRKL